MTAIRAVMPPRTIVRPAPALVLAALGFAAGAAHAQTPATVSVDDVRVRGRGRHALAVSVLDASGVPVGGLEQSFRVTLDGSPVEGLSARPARALRSRATVTIIVDASLFGGATLGDFQTALRELAREIAPNDRLRVVAVSDRARTREADAHAADGLVEGLASLGRVEPPRLYDALVDAVRESSRLPQNRGGVVLVVTRGADGGSRRGPIDVLALARSRARLTPVMVVLLGSRGASPEAERLRRLAASTGGAFAEATSGYGLGPVLGGLAKRGLDHWHLTFSAPGWKRDLPTHHLSMVVEHAGTRRAADADYDTAEALPASWWSQPLPWLLLGLALALSTGAWALTRRHQRGLLVHDGDDWDGVWYDLFGFPISIGAAAGNDLVLGDTQVSRNHAVLERRGKVVEVADLNSENGTFVNGERVSRRVLADGDRVSFGPAVHLIYEARG